MLNLSCPCGASATFATNEAAYKTGWRLGRHNAQLCPRCIEAHEKRSRRKLVKVHGEARVRFAETCVRRLCGE